MDRLTGDAEMQTIFGVSIPIGKLSLIGPPVLEEQNLAPRVVSIPIGKLSLIGRPAAADRGAAPRHVSIPIGKLSLIGRPNRRAGS